MSELTVEKELNKIDIEPAALKELDKGREKLPEERFFDNVVYGGISFAAQAATGITLLRWMKHSSGKGYFDKAAQWVGPKVFPSMSVPAAAKEISSLLTIGIMVMVGNTFIVPVKMLENRKPQIVRWLHERNMAKAEAKGQVFTQDEKEHDQKLLHELEVEPKQTWWSLLSGRAFGLAIVFGAAALIGNDRNEMMQKYSTSTILKGIDMVGLKTLAKNEKLAQYLHLGFVDLFYSAVAAGGLYVCSHTIMPPKKHQKAPEPETAAIPAVPAEAITETAFPKNFTSSIKPAKNNIITPSELYTKRIAAEELHDDARAWDRSSA